MRDHAPVNFQTSGCAIPLKVMVATKPVDFRKGAIGLAAQVEHELAGKPFWGVAWVFRSKRANRIKLLVWDGSGLVLVSKVLQAGAFHWPGVGDGVMRLSAAQMSALFEGLQWSRMHVPSTPEPIAAQLIRKSEPVVRSAATPRKSDVLGDKRVARQSFLVSVGRLEQDRPRLSIEECHAGDPPVSR
ncbi:transposase [Sphingomonas populi]|uniref:Transposase n=1 Tax=Sphingomonas populi TaxID=2484750 RepID=A0A4Q6XFJ9_9SPHN|nr:transposase [Sphingomonas populi]